MARFAGQAIVILFAVIGAATTVRELAGQSQSPFATAPTTHIGVIVQNVAKTAAMIEDVFGVTVPPATTSGYTKWDGAAGPVQWRVKLTSFKLGTMTLELVEPLDEHGPHRAHLEKYGQGLHHIGFVIPDRDAGFRFLKQKGGVQVSPTYVDMKDLVGFTVEIAPAPRLQ